MLPFKISPTPRIFAGIPVAGHCFWVFFRDISLINKWITNKSETTPCCPQFLRFQWKSCDLGRSQTILCRWHPYLRQSGLKLVVRALVTIRLDYCNVLYVGLPLKTAWRLQLVLNTASERPWKLDDSTLSDCCSCNCTGCQFVSEYNSRFVLVLTFKALHASGQDIQGTTSSYMSWLVPRGNWSPPPPWLLALTEARVAATRGWAFSLVVLILWNPLQAKLRMVPSLEAFRWELKTFPGSLSYLTFYMGCLCYFYLLHFMTPPPPPVPDILLSWGKVIHVWTKINK